MNKSNNDLRSILVPSISEKTVYAIVLLRVLATCLITNTHYNNIYPSERFAVGGLLGDVLFFSISGFCYANGISKSFPEWYVQRWKRIYPAVLIMSIINFATGFWTIESQSPCDYSLFDVCAYYILPTRFLFFGAIMILYIPMYFCVNSKRGFRWFLLVWAMLYLLFYLIVLDKTKYNMNAVSNPAVLFLYFGSILVGVVQGKKKKRFPSSVLGNVINIVSVLVLAAIYFGLTIGVRSDSRLYPIQIIVPLSLLLLNYSIIECSIGFENAIRKLPKRFIGVLSMIANLTLEIYVVQLIIINRLNLFVFPFNWIVVTLSILLSAVLLKLLIGYIPQRIKTMIPQGEK